jgi:rhodanese-related sulfurtransferase
MQFPTLLCLAGLILTPLAKAEETKPAPEQPQEAAASDKPIHVDPLLAASVIKTDKPVLLDVRTPGEFATGTIKGSKNIDFNSPDFEKELAKLDKSETYLVYCRSGNRSGQALPILKKLKLAKLYHLDGGLNAWKKAGHPVE